jgi:alpha-1,2-mannosyltransferase
VTALPPARRIARRLARHPLLWAGVVAFAVAMAAWVVYWLLIPYTAVFPVDLAVYRDGGLIARGVAPYYDPRVASPLYDWGGYSNLALKFTYTPFAAIAFALASFLSPSALIAASVAGSVAALVAAQWFTLGGLARQGTTVAGSTVTGSTVAGSTVAGGLRDPRTRAGLALLCAAAALWTQPVLRTLNLGQVNLVLMALILWDLCQPGYRAGGRRSVWKGFGTGVAAGVKLVPLVFVPYLLATRRFREAAMTLAGFAVTVAVGFAVLPSDSATWWLHGVALQGNRAGFLAWAGNQSLLAVISRFAGSVAAGTAPWAVAAAIVMIAGIGAAALLSRAGHEVPGLLMTALTGLLASPISWDHHWVWIAPGFTTAVVYAARCRGAARRWLAGVAAAILVAFGGWPDALWESARNLGRFSLGFLWAPPNTDPALYVEHGDQPWFAEYHWHGLWLVTGNAYVLSGLVMFAGLCGASVTLWRRSRPGSSRAVANTPRADGPSAGRQVAVT